MKKLFFLFILSPIYITASGQKFEWAKNFAAPDDGFAHSMVIDSKGNVYTTGRFRGTADFDPGTKTYNLVSDSSKWWWDVFISKIDANGNFVWAKRIGGSYWDEGKSIVIDSSGNVYVAGQFSKKVDFDPGSGVYDLTASKDLDFFILKLDSMGNFKWAKKVSATTTEIGISMALDKLGYIYATADFNGTSNFDLVSGSIVLNSTGVSDIFILKLDADGNFIWVKQIGGSGLDFVNAICIDASGNIYTSGYFKGKSDFDPGTGTYYLTSLVNNNSFILKLNSKGNFEWAKQISGNASKGKSIINDKVGNIYIVGDFYGTCDFNPGSDSVRLIPKKIGDVFILKLNPSGSFVWVKQLESDNSVYGNCIALDKYENIYISGYFSGTTDFNPDADTNYFKSGGNANSFILELNKNGDYLWAKHLSGKINNYGSNVKIDKWGNIYLAGSYSGTVDFDPGSGTYNLTAKRADIFISKLSPCSPFLTDFSIKGPSSICEGVTLDYSYKTLSNVSYKWIVPEDAKINSGQNTSSLNISFGKNSGQIALIVTNDCRSYTIYKDIKVEKQFKADFTAKDVCETDSVKFINQSNGADYKWKFGDGKYSTLESPKYLYPITGVSQTYNVTLVAVVTAGCSDSIIKSVTVNANPVSDFNFVTNKNKVDFKASQTGNTKYTWLFGNGDSVSGQYKEYNYTYSKPGKYTACLKVINAAGCFSENCKEVLTTVSVSNIKKMEGFKIYPNPNTGSFNIVIENPGTDFSVELYNSIGEKVKDMDFKYLESYYPVNLNLSPGIYLLKIKNLDLVYFSKLVVNQ